MHWMVPGIVAFLLALMTGCVAHDESCRKVPVCVSADIEAVATRSALTLALQSQTEVRTVLFAAYDSASGILADTCTVTTRSAVLNLDFGGVYDVFALLNLPGVAAPDVKTAMMDLRVPVDYALIPQRGMPASGYVSSRKVTGESFSIVATRLLARIRIMLESNSVNGLTIDAVSVHNLPADVTPFATGSVPRAVIADPQGSTGAATGSEIAAIGRSYVDFYVLENCCGTPEPLRGNTNPALKTPDDACDPSLAERATYVSVDASFSGQSRFGGAVTYRIFPGRDNCSNFDIERSKSYSVRLRLSPDALADAMYAPYWKVDTSALDCTGLACRWRGNGIFNDGSYGDRLEISGAVGEPVVTVCALECDEDYSEYDLDEYADDWLYVSDFGFHYDPLDRVLDVDCYGFNPDFRITVKVTDPFDGSTVEVPVEYTDNNAVAFDPEVDLSDLYVGQRISVKAIGDVGASNVEWAFSGSGSAVFGSGTTGSLENSLLLTSAGVLSLRFSNGSYYSESYTLTVHNPSLRINGSRSPELKLCPDGTPRPFDVAYHTVSGRRIDESEFDPLFFNRNLAVEIERNTVSPYDASDYVTLDTRNHMAYVSRIGLAGNNVFSHFGGSVVDRVTARGRALDGYSVPSCTCDIIVCAPFVTGGFEVGTLYDEAYLGAVGFARLAFSSPVYFDMAGGDIANMTAVAEYEGELYSEYSLSGATAISIPYSWLRDNSSVDFLGGHHFHYALRNIHSGETFDSPAYNFIVAARGRLRLRSCWDDATGHWLAVPVWDWPGDCPLDSSHNIYFNRRWSVPPYILEWQRERQIVSGNMVAPAGDYAVERLLYPTQLGMACTPSGATYSVSPTVLDLTSWYDANGWELPALEDGATMDTSDPSSPGWRVKTCGCLFEDGWNLPYQDHYVFLKAFD